LWCILGAIFCSSAKTLRGRKDILAQVYFIGGQSPPSPPPGIDATVYRCINEFTDQDNSCCRKFVCEVNQCYRSVGLSFAAVFARCRHTKAAQATTLPVLVEVQTFTLWTFPFGHFPVDARPRLFCTICRQNVVFQLSTNSFHILIFHFCQIVIFAVPTSVLSGFVAVLLLVLLLKFAYF